MSEDNGDVAIEGEAGDAGEKSDKSDKIDKSAKSDESGQSTKSDKIEGAAGGDAPVSSQPDEDDFFKEFEFSAPKNILAALRKQRKPRQSIAYSPDDGEPLVEEEEEEEYNVLEPNHPLLEKFQRAFKEHLLKQIERLREDVLELENATKKRTVNREQIGVEAYETQQDVMKQQQSIDEYVKELQTVTGAKQQLEQELEEMNRDYREKKNRMMEAERKECELKTEVESTNVLVHQMVRWNEEIESDLIINQRVAEKTRKDKLQLAEEKKKQDYLLLKLTNEVWRLEDELGTMIMQLRVKEEEREKLAEAVALSNIDIEANEAEHRCLIHGWQSVLVTITNRDKHYNELNASYRKLEEKLSRISVEIIQCKKACHREMLHNETLTVLRDRVAKELKSAIRLYDNEIKKRNEAERKMMQLEQRGDQLSKDLERIQGIYARLNSELMNTVRMYDARMTIKLGLEEEIFLLIQEKISANKTSVHLHKMARKCKEKTRSMKITLSKIDNNIGTVLKDIQSLELEAQVFDQTLEAITVEIENEYKELQISITNSEKCANEVEKRMRSMEMLKNRLAKINEERNACDLTPQEIRIRQLEGNINDVQEQNAKMQWFWLREQAIVVDLSEKRQEQLRDLNILKKQTTILDQKNLKINDDLEFFNSQERVINRSIGCLQNKLTSFTETLDRKKGSKQNLDTKNNSVQIDLVMKLEEAELEALKIQAQLDEIEEDKSTLSTDLLDQNREALGWEKKIQMALETKKNMKEEHADEGEIGKMRAEIHRMHVRHSQLRKAQDKLIADLEHCVIRRDAIVNVAEARTKYLKGGTQRVRINFTKRTDDMKNKLKQIEADDQNVDVKLEQKEIENEKLKNEIVEGEEEILDIVRQAENIANGIIKKKIDKQLNLDVLLFKQRKLKIYSELARGRLPFTTYKSSSSTSIAYEREKETNAKLILVVENLLGDFPNHKLFLTKAHNSLLIPALNL